MSSAAWFVEIATNVNDTLLVWEQAEAAPGVPLAFEESDRRTADRCAIMMANALGDEAVIRVRHRLGDKRGVFFPRPRPARKVAA